VTTTPTPSTERPNVGLICLAAWLVPGLGHALYGKMSKAIVLLVVIVSLYAAGLACGGRLFPFAGDEPLVYLAALAQWAIGAPRALAFAAGWGAGDVVAATYEYGNTFLIVAGLLNMLTVLDVFDIGRGRKS